MIENLSSWWQVLRQFTNPFHIVTSAVLSGLAAFAVVLVLVIVFRRKILVQRRHGILKVLAWLYLIGLPLLAGVFGLKYGLIRGVHKDLYEHASLYTGGLDAWLNASYGQEIKSISLGGVPAGPGLSHELSTNEVIDRLSTVAYSKYGAALEHELLSNNKAESILAALLLKATKSDAIAWATKKGLRKTFEKTLGIDEKVSGQVMNTRIQELLDRGLCTTILKVQLDKIFGGMARGVLITFCLILLLPAMEIWIAHWLLKKQRQREHDLLFKQEIQQSAIV